VAKAAGGWSLEMIDTKNPCSGVSNWKACTDASGGTPGRKNSMDALNKDAVSPNLLRAFANDSSSLTLYFDEPLDAISATDQNNYSVSDGIGTPVSVAIDSMGFAKTKLVLQNVLQPGRTYTLTVNGVTDCSGNKIGSNNARVGLASAPDSFDIVINEILFDPAPASVDYLELFNRSNKIIDLSKLSVANRSSSNGNIGTPEVVAGDHYLFFPGDFIALSSEPATIAREYLVKFPERIQMVSLPSFPDTKGNAILLNKQGTIIDELGYDAKWHFALLDNAEAVSLERIDYNRPTNEPSNWTSAASTAGFGTPGYINSQFRADLTPGGQITINPKLFSPDNDGFDDLAFIEFMFPEPGYVANVTIYDAAGRSVRLLQRNTTCAAKGSFRWDGLDDKMNRVTAGSYIVFTDIFNLKGQKRVFKNTVFVAKKF
jgi:hypothetical protein